MWKDLSMKQRS
jgi:hypothetical protein